MLTLERAVDLFLNEYKPSTRRAYYYVLKAMEAYVGPNRPLDKIGAEVLLEYLQTVRSNPAIKSTATYNKHVKSIRTFFNWCVKQRWLVFSPADGTKRAKQNKYIGREKAMPDHLFDRLLDYAQWEPRLKALVLFLGDTGCRIGGAAGLRWVHLDFTLRKAVVTEKGEKTRPVFFGEECARALLYWRDHHPLREGDYVFSKTGRRIKADNLAQYFRRMCQQVGIGSWGPHSLRHRKGHQFADAGIAPSIAAQALGHESVTTTLEFYYPADWERVQAAMEKLAHSDAPRPSKIRKFQG